MFTWIITHVNITSYTIYATINDKNNKEYHVYVTIDLFDLKLVYYPVKFQVKAIILLPFI